MRNRVDRAVGAGQVYADRVRRRIVLAVLVSVFSDEFLLDLDVRACLIRNGSGKDNIVLEI